jgi:hypothetical protein
MDLEAQVNKLRDETECLKTQLRSLNEILDRKNQEIEQLIKSNRGEADKLNNQDLLVSKESYEGNLFCLG